jgi:outer membrane protein assembly factor BamE (lipoprotein component of BamABCDE complex)
MVFSRVTALIAVVFACGCSSVEQSPVADAARRQMIGMGAQQVLACMGTPSEREVEGDTEVWSYAMAGSQTTTSWREDVSDQDSCSVNFTMKNGRVAQMKYVGTGGFYLTGKNVDCSPLVQRCVR